MSNTKSDDVKLTPERVNWVKNNLNLSNQELIDETGMTEYEVYLIRRVEEGDNLTRKHNRNKSLKKVEQAEDKFTVDQAQKELNVSVAQVYKDMKNLDFLKVKKIDGIFYLTSEELRKYKKFYDEL